MMLRCWQSARWSRRRHRYHLQRQDSPRELLQQVRHRTGRHRYRTSCEVPGRSPGTTVYVPRIAGPYQAFSPGASGGRAFLRSNTNRTIKVTVSGPFTMSQQPVDEHYKGPRTLGLAYAAAVRRELEILEDATP